MGEATGYVSQLDRALGWALRLGRDTDLALWTSCTITCCHVAWGLWPSLLNGQDWSYTQQLGRPANLLLWLGRVGEWALWLE